MWERKKSEHNCSTKDSRKYDVVVAIVAPVSTQLCGVISSITAFFALSGLSQLVSPIHYAFPHIRTKYISIIPSFENESWSKHTETDILKSIKSISSLQSNVMRNHKQNSAINKVYLSIVYCCQFNILKKFNVLFSLEVTSILLEIFSILLWKNNNNCLIVEVILWQFWRRNIKMVW